MATPRTNRSDSGRSGARRPARTPRTGRAFLITLLLVATGIGVWLGYGYYTERHVTIAFARADAPVPPLELTFFPEQLAFSSPSPPPPLGEARLTGADSLVVGDDLVPDHGVVRYRGAGVGAGFAYVRLGQPLPRIELRPPQSLTGRVGEPVYYWCMGWRCAGFRPVVDAEVVVMGGGEHGVDLASARTDEQGVFELSGFDGELDALGLRVRAAGFEVAHQSIERLSEHDGERGLVTLSRVPPRRGRLDLEPGLELDPTQLVVLARGLPGVDARPQPSGEFVLDHVPPDVEARIVVYGLPPGAAQAEVRTSRDGEVRVPIVAGAIVRGRVLGEALAPVAGALVWIGNRPAVRTDEHGGFELQNVLPGEVTIVAQKKPKQRRAKPWIGARTLRLAGGETYERIELVLER